MKSLFVFGNILKVFPSKTVHINVYSDMTVSIGD